MLPADAASVNAASRRRCSSGDAENKRFSVGHVLSCALEELSAGGLALADQRRDLVVVEIEDLAKQQDGPLGGRQPLEHDQERHRDLIEHLHAADASFVEVDGLRQTVAAALLATRSRRIELVETQPRHQGHEIRARRLDLDVPAAPAQPRLLHDVFGAPEIAKHAVRVSDEQGPMRFEDVQIVGRGAGHQNGLTSIKTVIAAMSALMPNAIRSSLRRTAASAISWPSPRRTVRRACPWRIPVTTSSTADPRNHHHRLIAPPAAMSSNTPVASMAARLNAE